MIKMPESRTLVKEMKNTLPLFCFSKKRNTKALAEQGVKLSERTRLEVIGVRDFLEAGGVMCDIRHPQTDNVLVMSVTGLDFKDNGPIDEKITAYANARIEWLKQEERRDFKQGLEERIQAVYLSNTPKISRNSPCPCGSGKKYKHCCGK
jgi:hypothetical protein